jgi:hypothetical protein
LTQPILSNRNIVLHLKSLQLLCPLHLHDVEQSIRASWLGAISSPSWTALRSTRSVAHPIPAIQNQPIASPHHISDYWTCLSSTASLSYRARVAWARAPSLCSSHSASPEAVLKSGSWTSTFAAPGMLFLPFAKGTQLSLM